MEDIGVILDFINTILHVKKYTIQERIEWYDFQYDIEEELVMVGYDYDYDINNIGLTFNIIDYRYANEVEYDTYPLGVRP